ncbi:MAG: acetylglutamate kinase [Deltaproteobacteria bacterium]|jgi:acetylglutamate kinase|nr:acetylglutamate kinase [Deltaproteobacteria bacterium]
MIPTQAQAKFLIECLPYIRRFSNQIVVVKYGGHAMTEERLKKAFALNIALMKYVGVKPVIVHGGGPQIARMLDRLQISSSFHEGLRITDDATMEIVEMILGGQTNKDVVNLLTLSGARAVGISGKDAHLLRVKKAQAETVDEQGNKTPVDIGWVGEVTQVDVTLINTLIQNDFIPVVAPIGVDEEGRTYNVNADSAAGAVAAALRAKRFLLLTDVAGVLDKDKNLIHSLSVGEAARLFADGTLSGGMIPKIKCCLDAVRGGVEKAMIIDGRVENCILLELFTDKGIGTEITA